MKRKGPSSDRTPLEGQALLLNAAHRQELAHFQDTIKLLLIDLIGAHVSLRRDKGEDYTCGGEVHYRLLEAFGLHILSDADKASYMKMAQEIYPEATEAELQAHCRFAAYNEYISLLAERNITLDSDGRWSNLKAA